MRAETINQVVEHKKSLEKEIFALIDRFNEESDAPISSITLLTVESNVIGGKLKLVGVKVEILL